jgi:hypothetical protein
LLAIQRKKAAGTPICHAPIDEIQIERQLGIISWRGAKAT